MQPFCPPKKEVTTSFTPDQTFALRVIEILQEEKKRRRRKQRKNDRMKTAKKQKRRSKKKEKQTSLRKSGEPPWMMLSKAHTRPAGSSSWPFVKSTFQSPPFHVTCSGSPCRRVGLSLGPFVGLTQHVTLTYPWRAMRFSLSCAKGSDSAAVPACDRKKRAHPLERFPHARLAQGLDRPKGLVLLQKSAGDEPKLHILFDAVSPSARQPRAAQSHQKK